MHTLYCSEMALESSAQRKVAQMGVVLVPQAKLAKVELLQATE